MTETFVLGQIQAIHVGTTQPTNTNMVWLDTNTTPATHKAYDSTTSTWVAMGVGAQNLEGVLAIGNTSGANDMIIDDGQTLTAETLQHATAMSISAPTINLNATTAINLGTNPTLDNAATSVLALDGSQNIVRMDVATLSGGAPVWDPLTSTITTGGGSVQLSSFVENAAELMTIGTSAAVAKLTVRGGGANVITAQDSTGVTLFNLTNGGNIQSQASANATHQFSAGGGAGAVSFILNSDNNAVTSFANRSRLRFGNDLGAGNDEWFALGHSYSDTEHFAIWSHLPTNTTSAYHRPAFWVYAGDNTATYKNATVLGGSNTGPSILDLNERSLWINHETMYMMSPDTPAVAAPVGVETVYIPKINGTVINANNYFHQRYEQIDDTDGNSRWRMSFGDDVSRGMVLDNAGQLGIGVATALPLAGLHLGAAHDLRLDNYASTRDDSGTFTPVNILYTDASGNVLSSPIGVLTGADNLGNHTATQDLVMGTNNITGVGILESYTAANRSYWNVLGNYRIEADALGAGTGVFTISGTTGQIGFQNYTFPTADGTANQVLATNAGGVLSFASVSGLLDINGLTAETVLDGANDEMVIYDASEGANNKVILDTILKLNVAADTNSDTLLLSSETLTFVGLDGIVTNVDAANNEIEFSVDINELTAEATVDGANDYVMIYDASVTAHRKVLVNNISGGGDLNIAGNTGTGDTISLTSETLTFTGANGITAATASTTSVVTLEMDIVNMTALGAPPVAADLFPIYDASGTANRSITLTNLLGAVSLNIAGDTNTDTIVLGTDTLTYVGLDGVVTNVDAANNEVEFSVSINELTTTAVDVAADFLMFHDTSGAALGKALVSSLTTFNVDTNLSATGTITPTVDNLFLSGVAPIRTSMVGKTVFYSFDLTLLTTETSIVALDEIIFYDASASTNKNIVFSDFESSLAHNNLSGIVANEHIDHSTVTITAGEGLTGGGDITVTRTIDFDLASLTAATPTSLTNDSVPFDLAGANRKMTIQSLWNSQSLLATNTTLVSTAEIPYHTAGVAANMTYQDFFDNVNVLVADSETGAASLDYTNDFMVYHNNSSGNAERIELEKILRPRIAGVRSNGAVTTWNNTTVTTYANWNPTSIFVNTDSNLFTLSAAGITVNTSGYYRISIEVRGTGSANNSRPVLQASSSASTTVGDGTASGPTIKMGNRASQVGNTSSATMGNAESAISYTRIVAGTTFTINGIRGDAAGTWSNGNMKMMIEWVSYLTLL